jgi:hypothetical protein
VVVGSAGLQASLGLGHVPVTMPPHACAYVTGCTGRVVIVGAHDSEMVRGPTVTDWTPPEIDAGAVQLPSQVLGGSKGMSALGSAQVIGLVLAMVGSAHDPLLGSAQAQPHSRGSAASPSNASVGVQVVSPSASAAFAQRFAGGLVSPIQTTQGSSAQSVDTWSGTHVPSHGWGPEGAQVSSTLQSPAQSTQLTPAATSRAASAAATILVLAVLRTCPCPPTTTPGASLRRARREPKP